MKTYAGEKIEIMHDGKDKTDSLEAHGKTCPTEEVGHDVHRIPRHKRTEYIRLTLKKLCLSKLGLHHDAQSTGTVFPVLKSGDRQRVVWHVTFVSEASTASQRRED